MPPDYPPSNGRSHPLAGTAAILVVDPDYKRWDVHLTAGRSIFQVVTQVGNHDDANAAVLANAGLHAVVLVGSDRWTKSVIQLLASRNFSGLVVVLKEALHEPDQSDMEQILPGQTLFVEYSFLRGRARQIFNPLYEFPEPDADRFRQIVAGIIARAPHIEPRR